MPLTGGWSYSSLADDECEDVVMQDPPCWTATDAVRRAGRELSSWFFNNPSPPPTSSELSFLCKNSLTTWDGSTHTAPINSPRSPSTLLPYVDVLPPELLEEIFSQYLHGNTTTLSPAGTPLQGSFRRIRTSYNARTTPFTLAHVCSSWRTVAMSSASLWSRICASLPKPVDVPLFEFWLSRSSGRPLDLTIVQKAKIYGDDIDIAALQILSLAISHSARWRTISLHLGQDMEPLLAEACRFLPLSSLQNIDIDLQGWTTQGTRSILGTVSLSPRLRHAVWGGSCQLSTLSEVSWAGLSTACFGRIDLPDLYWFLSQVRTLMALTVDSFVNECSSAFLAHCFANPLLVTSLSTLSFAHYNNLAPFFNMLSVPSLCTLILKRGMGAISSWASGWASLHNLVQRSGCEIETLTWSHCRLPEPTFVANFSEASSTIFPHLTHLNIKSPVGDDTILALNLNSASGGPIFPHLRSLVMRYCKADPVVVEDMLKSRPCLESASIEMRYQDGTMIPITYGASSADSSGSACTPLQGLVTTII